jgi:hypothetical protein
MEKFIQNQTWIQVSWLKRKRKKNLKRKKIVELGEFIIEIHVFLLEI